MSLERGRDGLDRIEPRADGNTQRRKYRFTAENLRDYFRNRRGGVSGVRRGCRRA